MRLYPKNGLPLPHRDSDGGVVDLAFAKLSHRFALVVSVVRRNGGRISTTLGLARIAGSGELYRSTHQVIGVPTFCLRSLATFLLEIADAAEADAWDRGERPDPASLVRPYLEQVKDPA